MVDEPLDAILIQVTIPLPTPMIYAAWTDGARLAGWLCRSAEVGGATGEPYALTFQEPEPFESRGTIVRRTPDVDIGFTWIPPARFVGLMDGSTRVYVRLQESPEGIDVTLEHDGWGAGDAWEEARSWHFHFWDERLGHLKEQLIREAYG
ncbi:MAG TPA: SRPBCC domain-containing protein [Thermoplasmata archaeon]|nr:SRPBCC domain-containing protein [Thermoplasmata archaeon]